MHRMSAKMHQGLPALMIDQTFAWAAVAAAGGGDGGGAAAAAID